MRCLTLCSVIACFISCSKSDKDYQVPENIATSDSDVNLFRDSTAIKQFAPSKILRAGSHVYSTSDTIVVYNAKYARVVWGDSTAFVLTGQLMPRGKKAVVLGNSKLEYSITIYRDREMTQLLQGLYPSMVIMTAGQPQDDATPVLVNISSGVIQGFVHTSQVHTDSLSLAFYHDFYYSTRNQVQNEKKYFALGVYKALFTSDQPVAADLATNNQSTDTTGDFSNDYELEAEPENPIPDQQDEQQVDVDSVDIDHTENDATMAATWLKPKQWILTTTPLKPNAYRTDVTLPKDSIPAITKFMLVFEDGSEMPAQDLEIVDGYAFNRIDHSKVNSQPVKQLRAEITSKIKGTVKLAFASICVACHRYDDYLSQAKSVNAGETFSFTVTSTTRLPKLFCSLIHVDYTIGVPQPVPNRIQELSASEYFVAKCSK
ncbi:MAG: hypothetical protein WDO15_04600 [Bacteroidota bacterium]